MNDFLLTLPACWVYARCAIAKSMDGFDSLLDKRILPLCGIFYVRYLFALLFLWAGILGSRKARRSYPRSVNPIYPPAPCPARVAVFSRPFKQRSMNHE